MLKAEQFWEDEQKALLLERNGHFVTRENAELRCKEAEEWLDLIPKDVHARLASCISKAFPESNDSDIESEFLRIFELDAERTFASSGARKSHTNTLCAIYRHMRDYHQGMGFVVAFLELFISRIEDIVLLTLYLNEVFEGYFKSAPKGYFRDTRVFRDLLEERYGPNNMLKTLPPETYCSKWFVGMNVHVLTFEALFKYFSFMLTRSSSDDMMLCPFQFGLALIEKTEQSLMETAGNISKQLAILRLDKAAYPNDKKSEQQATEEGSFFTDIVEHAYSIRIEIPKLIELRQKAEIEMNEAEKKRKEQQAQELSDDEIIFSDEE